MSTPQAIQWHPSNGGVGIGVLLPMSGVNQRPRLVGDKYEIERHLATGGMGELYVARHVLTTQRVALKVLDRRLARNEASIERFLREVRLGAKIGHPAIVQVYDAGLHLGDDGPVPYLAMELLQGMNLAERIVKGDVTQAAALSHLATLLDALAVAHAKGVVHRDLKPENVFIERLADGSERVRLLDLGIARESTEANKATLAGQALGTVYYMAPEQSLDARSATPVSDVWSLGAILYQCLAGVFPFDGDTAAAVLLRACRDPHRPLTEARPDLDLRLTLLVDRCLSKNPVDRPRDASDLRAELVPLLADPAIYASLVAQTVTTWTFQPAEPAHFDDPFAARAEAPIEPAPEAPTPHVATALAAPSSYSDTRPSSVPFAATQRAEAPRSRRSLALLALVVPLLAGAWFALRPVAATAPRAAPTATVAPTAPRAPVAPAPIAETAVTPAPTVVAPSETVTPPPPPRARRLRTAASPTPAQALSALPEPTFAEPPPAPRIAAPARTHDAAPSAPPPSAPPLAAAPAAAPAPVAPTHRPAPVAHDAPAAAPDFVTF